MRQGLRDKIAAAFPLRPAPGYRFSDAIRDDDHGSSRNVFDESWSTWAEIETWQIEKASVFFSFAPSDAAAYATPRFMLYVLDLIEGAIPQSDSDSGDLFIWWLQRQRLDLYAESGFTQEQTEVVKMFLEEIATDSDCAFALGVGGD